MTGLSSHTLSDLCIDYLVKNHFELRIECCCDQHGTEWIDWSAERGNWCLYATAPVELTALYMICDDWELRQNQPPKGTSTATAEDDQNYFHTIVAGCGGTDDTAIDKLNQWEYTVSAVEDSADFVDNYIYIAEKSGKKYSAASPLRLLGLVIIIQEYGADWAYSDVARTFSIEPIPDEYSDSDILWGKILDSDQIEED
ncbi:MAG: hypothetical protein NC489_44825 [Ruminococcus flavefaciens]|nr:hypothetical protein [Ruminococcus flavefaciens]